MEGFRPVVALETSIVWTVDESGRVVVAQPVLAAYTGQSWDEYRELGWINALHPDDRARVRESWNAARSAQVQCRWEGRLRNAALACYRHVEGSFSPLPTVGGTAREWVGVCEDVDDRKREEERLRESERRFLALFDSGPLAIFSCNRDGVIQDYNRQAAELWGREPRRGDSNERFCGSLRLYQRDGAPLPHSESPIVRVLRTGAVFRNVEVFIERPDGSRIAVVVTFAPLKSENGEITGALTSFYDITERKRSEDAVRASQARLEALFEAAPVGVYLVDAKMRIRQVNPKARPAFGENERLIGSDFAEVMHILWPPEIAERVVGLFRHTLETGEPFFHPEFSAERHGSHVGEYYEWQIHRITLPNGEYGVVCYFSDISAHVLARQALAESESRLRFMAESMPQKIFTAKPNGDVDYFNPQWSEFTGLSFEQIRNWGWTQFIHPNDVAENIRTWKHSIATGEPFHFEHRFRRLDGEYRWHISRAVALKDASGTVLMWVGSNTDIHDVKEADRVG